MQCLAFTLSADAQLGRCAPKRGKTRQKRPLFGYRLITRFYRPRLACCHARQGARSAAAGQRVTLPPRCRSRCRSSLQLVEVSRPIHAAAATCQPTSGRSWRCGWRRRLPGGRRRINQQVVERFRRNLQNRWTPAKKSPRPPESPMTPWRLVEVPASASSVHATGFQRIVRHLVPTTGRNAREPLPVRQRRGSCRQCKRQAAGRAGSWVP